MNITALAHRFRWLQMPTGLLVLLLQRTPMLRVVVVQFEGGLAENAPAILRSAFGVVALGAYNSLAGATVFNVTATPVAASPTSGAANTKFTIAGTSGTAMSVGVSVSGAPGNPKSFSVTGTLPTGLSLTGAGVNTWVNVAAPYKMTITGTPSAAGSFPVTITAWDGTGGSGGNSARITVTFSITGGSATAPSFTTQPTSLTVTAGNSASFTVATSGSPTPTYQWQLGSVNIAGATSATYSIASAAASDAGTYTAIATNSAGSATSTAAILTVNAATVAPAITTQPASVTVTAGGSASFTVTASGTPTPTYQWLKAGVNIAGATSATYSIASAAASDAGTYTAVANNSAGSATSTAATLTVNAATVAPAITTQPASVTVTAGGAASFAVTASGTPTPTYQWLKAGVNIAGATSATYSIASAAASDAGTYTAVATNSAGSATSAAAILTVNAATVAPAITTQPASVTVTAGGSASFTVTASGTPTPTYQWLKAGVNIAGATSATYSIASAAASDAGTYTAVANNSAGSATSTAATLTVNAATAIPSFTTQPQSQTAVVGGTVTFTVTASGSPTPTYQWMKGTAAIAGATSATLTLSNIQLTDGATYAITATNSAGSATSTGAVLTVTVPPTFTTQPASQTILVGASVTFTAAANGTPTPTYQWTKDGAAIVAATNASLTVSNAQLTDAATYAVIATNSAGSATSSAAVLTVNSTPVAPAFTAQPLGQSAFAGDTVTFTVAASGSPAPTYQWKKNGAAIAGATSTTFILNNVQLTDAGTYTAIATNSLGSLTSSGAVLTVSSVPPSIVTQPQSHTGTIGATMIFAVEATGSGLTYQWQKDSKPIAGATFSRLILSNVQAADAANYTVMVGNSSGGSITSNSASLIVITTSNPGRVINWSIRGTSGIDPKVLIMGFVAGGAGTSGSVPLLIRGVGPTLIPAPFNVTDAMLDPAISVIPAGSATAIASNDNWGGTAALKAAALATGAFPLASNTSLDAALLGNFPRNVYSVIVSGNNSTTGSVLAEIYDTNPSGFSATTPRLINVSARAYVGPTDTLTAGFVISGQTAKTVLIRGIGADAAFAAAVGNANLSDPSLVVYSAHNGVSTLILSNDNWGGDAQLASVSASVGAFTLINPASKDSELLVTLEPGVYTAQVVGVNGSAGIALLEVYDVN